MTKAQFNQSQPADVPAQQITSFAKVLDEDQLRGSRESTLRGEINRLMTMPVNTRRTLQACTDAIVKNLNVVFARIWTLKRGERVLKLQASSGLYTGLHGKYSRVPAGHLKIGLIAERRAPYLTNTALGDPRIEDQEWVKREHIVAFAGYPLVVDDRVVGVIAMFARVPIKPETLETIGSIAGIVAQGIERKRSQKELRRAIEAYNEAVFDERMRIAREMHDGLLQNVTGIALQLSAVLPRVRSAPEEAAPVLERILELTERTSTEARLAVAGMRHITESGDVVKMLRSTVEQALAESGLDLSVKVRGRTHLMPPPVCEATTLIVQHAVTNVLRHAQANRVRLAVEFGVRKLRIRIRDDGGGFESHQDTAEPTHFGLQGMLERAKEIGAELRVRSVVGLGTTVSLRVPYTTK
ncbi:MAG TPA: GAF domain-containing sensor histidine kinase [Gemmatimonadaceae bacterium]|nr:GAF domain-containing sensor histidine kinase [Gemmatimonadaceae bacterium]